MLNRPHRFHQSIVMTIDEGADVFFRRHDVICETRSRRERRRPSRLVASSARTWPFREHRFHQNVQLSQQCLKMRVKYLDSRNLRTRSKRRRNADNRPAAVYLVEYSTLRPSVGAPPPGTHISRCLSGRETPRCVAGPLRAIGATCTSAAARRDARGLPRCERRPRAQRDGTRP